MTSVTTVQTVLKKEISRQGVWLFSAVSQSPDKTQAAHLNNVHNHLKAAPVWKATHTGIYFSEEQEDEGL